MSANIESRATGEFAVVGELTFDSVPGLWQQAGKLFENSPDLQLDLSGVTRSDSSGVAMLVGWLRQARERQRELKFINTPDQMTAIIRVSGLEQVLPIV
jgi:phospholipid transport system transporter-binding protein